MVDNDLGRLERAANASHPRAKVTTAPTDLVRDLEAALDGPLDLVTTWDQRSTRMPRTIAMFEAVGYFVVSAAPD
jgi:hypothetical protein